MREILFRGKEIKTGKWLYGELVSSSNGDYYIHERNMPVVMYKRIITETVGQYTGLKDKNGKRIFEGDIVQWKDENFNNYTSVVEWRGEKWNYPAFDLAKHDYECNGLQYVHEDCIIEVIGTIYDNPELLEMKK